MPDSDLHIKNYLKNNHKAVVNILPTSQHKVLLVSDILHSLKKSYLEKYVRYHYPKTNPDSIKNELLNLDYSYSVITIAKSLGVNQSKLPCICFLEYDNTFRTIPISEKESLSSLLQQVKEAYNSSLPIDDGIRFKKVKKTDAAKNATKIKEIELEKEIHNLSRKVIKKTQLF